MSFFADDCTFDLPRAADPWRRRSIGKDQVQEGTAIGILTATGTLEASVKDNRLSLSALSFDGVLRHTQKILSMELTAREREMSEARS